MCEAFVIITIQASSPVTPKTFFDRNLIKFKTMKHLILPLVLLVITWTVHMPVWLGILFTIAILFWGGFNFADKTGRISIVEDEKMEM
jgi:hypothetical protein